MKRLGIGRYCFVLIVMMVFAAALVADEPAKPVSLSEAEKMASLVSTWHLIQSRHPAMAIVEPTGVIVPSWPKFSSYSGVEMRIVSMIPFDKDFKPIKLMMPVQLVPLAKLRKNNIEQLSQDVEKYKGKHCLVLISRNQMPFPKMKAQPYSGKQIYFGRIKDPHSHEKDKIIHIAEIGDSGSMMVKAVQEVLSFLDTNEAKLDQIKKLTQWLKCEDPDVRQTIAALAGANILNLNSNPLLRGPFADILLNTKDDALRREMARIYSMKYYWQIEDFLPDDADILAKLIGHDDPQTATWTVSYAAKQSIKKRKTIAPMLAARLAGDDPNDPVRDRLLANLDNWDQDILLLSKEVADLARCAKGYTASDIHRYKALKLLMRNEIAGSDELAMEMIGKFPIPLVMHHIARRDLRLAVPIIINAIRNKKLTWQPHVALALIRLTGKPQWVTFDKFDTWWRSIEKKGLEQTQLADGFYDADTLGRIKKSIEQLVSDKFSEREAAYNWLLATVRSIPDCLRDATESDSQEVCIRAIKIIEICQNSNTKLTQAIDWINRRSLPIPKPVNAFYGLTEPPKIDPCIRLPEGARLTIEGSDLVLEMPAINMTTGKKTIAT
ncbi:MAG TPA: hypothetical protein ENL03_01725, partial [Phycisphaerae bacterium]|nr:hypothetical protein [Phycisphaerae bacterium]